MRLGLLGRKSPGPHELGDEGVNLGQLIDLAVANQVGARVADVADRDDAVLEQRDGDRRAHPGSVGVLARPFVDLAVRLLDQRDDASLAAAVDGLAEGGCRDPGRDLAPARAAHPVRDREERRMADPGVLVSAAPPPRMREPRAPPELAHVSNLRSVPPTRTRSPAASLRARLSRTPLTNVPLVDPTSSIQTPSRRGSTRAWFAEA